MGREQADGAMFAIHHLGPHKVHIYSKPEDAPHGPACHGSYMNDNVTFTNTKGTTATYH